MLPSMLPKSPENAGFTTDVQHGPEADDVPQQDEYWLIITSTHGAGDLPKNIQPFADALREQQPDLSSVRYGAIGIGSGEDMTPSVVQSVHWTLCSHLSGCEKNRSSLEIDI